MESHSIQSDQQSFPEGAIYNSKKKFPLRITLLCLSVLVVLVLIVGEFILNSNVSKIYQKFLENTKYNPKITTENSLALIPYVPHFDTLNLQDLPGSGDVRSIFEYKSHKIIIGYNDFTEYDFAEKKFIRQRNSDVLPCVYSAAQVGNSVYIGCNGKEFSDPSVLYKIDLPTGKLVKKYDWFKSSGLKLVNINLAITGNILWISSWDGILRMDTVSEQTTFYPISEVFPYSCTIDRIFFHANQLRAYSGAGDCGGEADYNFNDDTWKYNTVRKYNPPVNQYLSDFDLHMPQFYGVSQKIDGKYYLFSDDGVYTLKRGQFPQLLFLANVASQFPVITTVYVNGTQTEAIQIGTYVGGIPETPTVENQVSANIVNLKTKEVTDLIANNPVFKFPVTSKTQQDIDGFAQAIIEKSPGGAIIKNKDGQPVAFINLQTKSLSFE